MTIPPTRNANGGSWQCVLEWGYEEEICINDFFVTENCLNRTRKFLGRVDDNIYFSIAFVRTLVVKILMIFFGGMFREYYIN